MDAAIAELEDGAQSSRELTFISYLLSREELSKKDIAIIVQSLFGDGLSTVNQQLRFPSSVAMILKLS